MDHSDVVVVYHHPCLDGMASRYAAWKHFGNKATYIEGAYEAELDLMKFANKRVYCVDFSYKCEDAKMILSVCKKLHVLDHHVTANDEMVKLYSKVQDDKDLAPKLNYSYNPSQSGAGIVWEAFHKEPLPKVLEHIQDRDLWRFNLENTKEICCYMSSLDYDFKKWVKAIEKESYREILSKGQSIRAKEIADIQKIIDEAEVTNLHGYEVPVITNCPKHYVSEACHKMLRRKVENGSWTESDKPYPFSANKSWNGKGWLWSLRSEEGGINVGELAQSLGGGGHKYASGYFEEHISL